MDFAPWTSAAGICLALTTQSETRIFHNKKQGDKSNPRRSGTAGAPS